MQIQVIILIQVFMNNFKGYPGLGDHITNKTRIANNFRHFAKQILATEDKEIIVNFLKIAFENDEISSNRTFLMNQFDKQSRCTILHIAAFYGPPQSVRIILEETPDVNKEDKSVFKETPLQLAVSNGQRDISRLLLNAGADINIKCITLLRHVEYGDTADGFVPHPRPKNALTIAVELDEIEIFLDIFEFSVLDIERKEYL